MMMVKLGPTKEEMEILGLEPLGKPFNTILHKNLWGLMEETPDTIPAEETAEADNGI